MPFTVEAIRKTLTDHKVDPFIVSTLGSAIGTLVDRGLSDDELLGICSHLINAVRWAVNDPATVGKAREWIEFLQPKEGKKT